MFKMHGARESVKTRRVLLSKVEFDQTNCSSSSSLDLGSSSNSNKKSTSDSENMSRQPEVLWAQRSDKVYLTVSLPDAKDISVKCEEIGLFTFSAVGANGEPFNFTLQLYGNVAPQGCKTKIGLRNILCFIQKEQKGWWKRLLKSEEKPAPYIKVDWNKWCDEDDEESNSNLASDGDDAYTGENEESSDDEGMLYLPDLEKARGS